MTERAGMTHTPPTIAILGGGINGAAVARELAICGANVTLFERGDIACGATAWSTRLVHGGLRYLEYGELDLVRESLTERERLVQLAGHLVEPLPFYIPLERRTGGLFAAAARLLGAHRLARWFAGGRPRGSWTVGIGLWLYDRLSGSDWPQHRLHRSGEPGQPEVDPRRYPLGASYVDAQMLFPERFTVELLCDAEQVAAALGTQMTVATHREVHAAADGTLHAEPNAAAQAAGISSSLTLRPDAIINASGAWVDLTRMGLPLAAEGPPLIGGTKGSHLVLDAAPLRARLHASGVYAEAADGRPMFVLPFGERLVLVGTTDLPFAGDPADAVASEEEVSYLLDACRQLFPQVAPGREAVLLHYCGVRPLPHAGSGLAPGAVTRRHLLVRHEATPVPSWSVVGGKLTTCRSLAESVAREVLVTLGWEVRGSSHTRPLPGLRGAETQPQRAALQARLQSEGRSPAAAQRLVELYGGRAVSLGNARSDSRESTSGRPLGACGIPAAAVWQAVQQEWALTLDDVVSRRLLLPFEPQFDLATLRAIAEILVAAGRLAADRLDAEVAAVAELLRQRHGLRLREYVAAGGEHSEGERT